jgi:hypothetical protein
MTEPPKYKRHVVWYPVNAVSYINCGVLVTDMNIPARAIAVNPMAWIFYKAKQTPSSKSYCVYYEL